MRISEIPAFVAEIRSIFERWQLAAYLEIAKESEPFDASLFEPQWHPILGEEEIEMDAEKIEEMRKDDIRQCTREPATASASASWDWLHGSAWIHQGNR